MNRGIKNMQRMDPKKQFSKWLARFGAIVWGIYAFAVLGLIAYRPEAAMACVWLTLIMTCNKALDTVSYTQNSTTEKILLNTIDKLQLELSLKGIAKNIAGSHGKSEKEDETDEEDLTDEEENGGDNG